MEHWNFFGTPDTLHLIARNLICAAQSQLPEPLSMESPSPSLVCDQKRAADVLKFNP